MPFVFTTAMTSEFPGVGVGPGVSDIAALSVVSPFSELDTGGIAPNHVIARSVLEVHREIYTERM